MSEYVWQFFIISALLNISIWPPLIYFQNRMIDARVKYLQASVDVIDELLDGNGPDDPHDGEPEPEIHSNVIAIGKRRCS